VLFKAGTDSVQLVRKPWAVGVVVELRHHFRRLVGVTPSDYRRRFTAVDAACAESA
jgi:AraC-like DNA-binding protein